MNPKALPNAQKNPLWPCSRGRTVRLVPVRDSFDVSGCLEQVRAAGGQAVLTGPGPERLHNLSGGEHDLTPEHWQLLRSPISATFLLPTADFVAGAARSRHERRVSGDPCKPRMIMMLERCPEEGSRIDWAAGAPRPIAATCCQLKINPVSKNNFTKSVLAPT